MDKIFRSTKERREMARKRLENREKTRGNDEEYCAELIKTYHKFEDIRKRAENVYTSDDK